MVRAVFDAMRRGLGCEAYARRRDGSMALQRRDGYERMRTLASVDFR
jgi:hypothetical protein